MKPKKWSQVPGFIPNKLKIIKQFFKNRFVNSINNSCIVFFLFTFLDPLKESRLNRLAHEDHSESCSDVLYFTDYFFVASSHTCTYEEKVFYEGWRRQVYHHKICSMKKRSNRFNHVADNLKMLENKYWHCIALGYNLIIPDVENIHDDQH